MLPDSIPRGPARNDSFVQLKNRSFTLHKKKPRFPYPWSLAHGNLNSWPTWIDSELFLGSPGDHGKGRAHTRIILGANRREESRSGGKLMATATDVVEIPIAGMTCDHCVKRVTGALNAVPGVESARVDLAEARAW